jgi:UPF0176 protein
MFTVLLFYTYTHIEQPEQLMLSQRYLWERFGATGRMIIAHEGINGTLEIKTDKLEAFEAECRKNPIFTHIIFKKSPGNGTTFPKISIKVREQLVALPTHKNINPHTEGGTYLSPDQLHQWYLKQKKFFVVDMRNDYEYGVGHFDNSIALSKLTHYRDLPEAVEEIASLKNETVVTVCTGGIRCETASALLQRYGFIDVYQLDGGIHSYLEKYPDGFWSGKLYVFDGRVILGFGGRTEEIIGSCRHCNQPTEHFVDVLIKDREHDHYLCCETCEQSLEVTHW